LIRGDLPFIPEEKVAGGRLRSILDCLVKYGGNEGILRLHIPMFRTLVFVSNPDMVCVLTGLSLSVTAAGIHVLLDVD
jgi:hypothetical protein